MMASSKALSLCMTHVKIFSKILLISFLNVLRTVSIARTYLFKSSVRDPTNPDYYD